MHPLLPLLDMDIRVGWKLKKSINEKSTMWFPFSYICRTEKYNYFQILRYFSYRGRNIKMVKMAKYGHFEYVVEYPIWVSIKRYWTGKLAIACQNWVYCIRSVENLQKPSKTECFRIQLFSKVFGRFLLNGCSKSNSDKLAPTYPFNTSW